MPDIDRDAAGILTKIAAIFFRGPDPRPWNRIDTRAWIGLMVVVQNISSSLFNSHIFDFYEGWMYVLGVGVAGGVLKCGGVGPTSRCNDWRIFHPPK